MNKKRKNNSPSTAKITIWYMASNVLSAAITFFITSFFSRTLSKTEFGQYSNFISVSSVLLIFVTLNFSSTVSRAKYEFKEKILEYLSTVVLVGNIITILLMLFIETQADLCEQLFSMNIMYIRIMFVYFIFTPAFTYLQTKHRIFMEYKQYVVLSICMDVSRALFAIVFVLSFDDKLLGRTIGDYGVATIISIVIWAYTLVRGKGIKFEYLKYALLIAVPLIPHALAGNILISSDKIMITHICGAADNALYSMAYSISTITSLIWTAMNQAWVPWMYDNMESQNIDSIRIKSKWYLGVFSVIVIGIFLVAPEVILLLGGEKYYEARYVMPPIILGGVFQFVYGMYVNIEIYMKKTFQISLGTMFAGGINVLLNMYFMPRFGYIAASYTTLIGFIFLFIFHYILVMKGRMFTNIYDKKFIFGNLVLLSIIGIASLVLYKYNELRYCSFFLYLCILLSAVIKYRKIILDMIK